MTRPVIYAVLGLLAFSGQASAKCEVTQPSVGFALGSAHQETDCASTSETNTELDKTADKSDTYTKVEVDGKVLYLQREIGNHEGRISENKEAIETNKKAINEQKTRLDSFNETGGSLETWATNVDTSLDKLNQANMIQDQHLAAVDRTLDKHASGIAIAMAMPDAWLSDRERYAFSVNVGGFDDKTALGGAAIIRLDRNWSANIKVGTDFEQIGWSGGVRVGF